MAWTRPIYNLSRPRPADNIELDDMGGVLGVLHWGSGLECRGIARLLL